MSAEALNWEELQADVVIIGGGGAGIPAAVAAVEAGARDVIVLEARRVPGGNAGGLAAIFAVESHIQRHLGIMARVDDAFKTGMDFAHWKINPELLRTLLVKTGETIAWLEGKGVKFTAVIPHYPGQVPATYHLTEAPIVQTLRKVCAELGVQVRCQTEAKELLTDEKGNVTGVLAVNAGRELRISAGSVIVATGGFAGNKELLKKYLSWFDLDQMMDKKEDMGIRHKGAGVRLVAAVGAAVDDTVAIALGGPRVMLPSVLSPFVSPPYSVWVNRNGERFADETIGFLFPVGANALNRQPGKISYTLFDEGVKQQVIADGLDTFTECHMADTNWPSKDLDKDFKAQSGKGKLTVADFWDEVADWIGADPAVLKATIEEYNADCDRGYDARMAKDRQYLLPLRTPPYYAVKCSIGVTTTHGPIRANPRMEVLNRQGAPIGGLYVAGVDIGGTDADTYNLELSGHSFGFSVCSGRIAGENAARYAREVRG